MNITTVGSVCSGIEAASVAWEPMGLHFQWFSEIARFPSQVLKEKHPNIINLGDMNDIPQKIIEGSVNAPDLICGGTPCQAFSLAGWQNGLNDDRGNLTMKFVEIVDANDAQRKKENLNPSVVFWENVEGVLTDKTNAFGCLVSSLAGFSDAINIKRWPNAGVIYGPKRNVAWRVLDAKFFGVPQQRRRLYLLAGGTDFFPENVLFERSSNDLKEFPTARLTFEKEGHHFEVFREYTDCLYAAYGTKWNGNAAAYNGSLFVVQDNRIRRLSPLECERLMGFPDNYTNIKGATRTTRYQAIGNSWAIPVIEWIGKKLMSYTNDKFELNNHRELSLYNRTHTIEDKGTFIDLGKDLVYINDNLTLNCTSTPENPTFSDMRDIVSPDAPENIYISPVGCFGIVRRKRERNLNMNPRLEEVLLDVASQMTPEEIEKRSRVQKRGRFSTKSTKKETTEVNPKDMEDSETSNTSKQISIFELGL